MITGLLKNNVFQSLVLALVLALLGYLSSNQELDLRTLAIAVLGAGVNWFTTHNGKAETRVQAQQVLNQNKEV